MNRKYIWLHILALVAYFVLTVFFLLCLGEISIPSDAAAMGTFFDGATMVVLLVIVVLLTRAAFRKINKVTVLIREARAAKRDKLQYK